MNTRFLQFVFLLFTTFTASLASAAKVKVVSPFTETSVKNAEADKLVSRYKILALDRSQVQSVFREAPQSIEFRLPGPNGEIRLAFESNEIHASDFKVLSANGKDVTNSLQLPLHFKGKNNSRGTEIAAITLFSDGNLVLLYSNSEGNVNCARLPESNTNEYIVFNDFDLKVKNPFHCRVEEKSGFHQSEMKISPDVPHVQDDTSCRVTEIYWECDNDMFVKGGSTIQGTVDQFEAMFNGTAILYEVENINIGIKAVKVWNTLDPYSYNTSFTALDDFQAAGNAANWPGQLAHLISTRPLRLGGVAYLNSICSSFRYGFSNVDYLFQPLPVYSWTLNVLAHELGHNFSSPHTQNCNWQFAPGVFHQIDSCYKSEGGCQDLIRPRVGTIMSYCHLNRSVNLSLGFGPLPGARIRQGFANMPCVSGTIVVPNFTPINSGPFCVDDTLSFSAENLAGYSYKWTGPNGYLSTERAPKIFGTAAALEGQYTLVVKKASCESRPKKTEAIFNCLKVGTLPLNLCAGSLLAVPLSTTGVFNPGNKFIAQLSNAIGSFSNPINLDTIEATVPQTYSMIIPPTVTLGNAFKIRFLSTNPVYEGKPTVKSFAVSAAGVSPTPVNGERCGAGSVKITAAGGTNFSWFTNPLDILPLSLSKIYQTPELTQSTSYYVQASATVRNKTGLSKNLATGSFANITDGLIFDALGGFRLDTVTLVAQAASLPSTITLQLISNNSIIYQSQVNVDQEFKKVALFWRVDPGTAYQLVCQGSTMFRSAASNWGSYPIKINGLLSIKSSISSPVSNHYPSIFDWVVQKYAGCPSKKVEVMAIIRQGEPPLVPAIGIVGLDSVFCSQIGITYEWLVNGVVLSTSSRKLKGYLNTNYQVRYKTDSCFSDWSTPFIFTFTALNGQLENLEPQIFPNPAKSRITWKGLDEPAELILVDMAGREIWHRKALPEDSFDVSSLPNGIYGIRWQSRNATGTVRFSKE